MSRRFLAVVLAALLPIALSSCHWNSNDSTVAVLPSPSPGVALGLAAANVSVGGQHQFSATVSGVSDNTLSWSVDNVAGGNDNVGHIDNTGRYTAPAMVPNPAAVTVKAALVADPAVFGSATVTLHGAVTLDLPSASVVSGGQQQFSVTVSGVADNTLEWSVDNVLGGNATVGTVDGTGLYTAPAAVPNPATVTVKAALAADPLAMATSAVTVETPTGSVTILASVADNGAQVNAMATNEKSAISGNGRYVVFTSSATNLVPGIVSGNKHVYVRDLQTGTTRIASLSSAGVAGDLDSFDASISDDGRYVAFESKSTNLVASTVDTNGNYSDIFVRDMVDNATTVVSIGAGGTTGTGDSSQPRISGDGQVVAFSTVLNLVPGDVNGQIDVYAFNRADNTMQLVSVATGGAQGDAQSSTPALSYDGRYVAFGSFATTLVADDTNGVADIFRRDRQSGTTVRVSVDGSNQGNDHSYNPSISADGRFVAFQSAATNLGSTGTYSYGNIYRRDLQDSVTARVTDGNGNSTTPSISANGRFISFTSYADNLVPSDNNAAWDVFRADVTARKILLVSVNTTGDPGNNSCGHYSSISSDGGAVAFLSSASDLVATDANGKPDVFARRQLPLP